MINTYDFLVERPRDFAQLAVKDSLFLHYRCPQVEKRVKLFTHYHKIMFVLEGKKMICSREKSWMVDSGKAVMLKRTAYQQERFDEEWEVLCFYIPDHFFKQFILEYRDQLPLKNSGEKSHDILINIDVTAATRNFFYSLIPYFTQTPAPSENILELKFWELLLNIFQNPANEGLLAYIYSLCENQKPLISQIMEANYTFNLSIAEFARLSHRSLASFKREFTQHYDTTPGKWLVQKRLQYAAYLLENSNNTINEITSDCGFENPTHFSRVFKEKFGLSPLNFRKEKQSLLQVS